MADIIVNPGATSKNITLNDAQNMFVMSTGVANNTTVNEDSYLYVSSGGIVNDTVINNWGGVELSGGTANKTVVNAGGNVTVYSKGKAIGTVVNGGMQVSSGGIASDTTVSTGGMYVFERGRIQGSTIVNQGGTATFEGGVYTAGIAVHGGMLILKSSTESEEHAGCDFNGIAIDSGGSLIISAGATASSATVGNGSVTVRKGGALENSILTNASVAVSAGAIVSSINLKEGAVMNVASDGTLRNVNVSAGGVLTGVLREASQLKFYGGTLDLNISGTSPDGEFIIDEQSFGAILEDGYLCTLTVSGTQADGTYNLIDGAAGFDKTITVVNTSGATLGTLTVAGGKTTIGGVQYKLGLDSAGLLSLTIGDSVDLTGDLSTSFDLNAGMVGSSVNILLGGVLDVLNGGFTSQTTVNSGGDLIVDGGGSADVVTVNFGGDLYVSNGATATLVKENGGYVYIDGGATVTFVPNSFGGYSYNNAGDWATIHSGTTGTDLTAGNGGGIEVFPVGTAVNTTIAADGELWGYPGGKLTGKITIETGAKVNIYDGAIVDFDLTKTTTADPALVNDLSFFGTEAVNYTLTVDETEADGDYKLAEGATGFDKTITVKDTLGTTLGTLTVAGGKTTIGGVQYKLGLDSAGLLSLTIGDSVDLTGDLSTSFELTAGMVGSSVNILDGGNLDVYDGGSADVVTVNFGGDLWVRFGGKATLVKENGGFVFVNDGATVTFVPNSFGGYVYNGNDRATIHSGTTGTDLTVGNDGFICVYSGGTAVDTTVAADGIFYVSSGGTATDTTVAADGLFYVSSGGTATGIVAEAGAHLTLTAAPGTYAQGTYAGSAFEIVENATDFTVHDNVALDVLSDGTAADTTVAAGGVFRVQSGGTAVDTTVAADGYLWVHRGGFATGIVAVDGARLELTAAPDTYAQGTYAGSAFEITDTVTDFTVHSGCELQVDGGGTADVVTVDFGGGLWVWAGGAATQVKENGGFASVQDGATVTFVPNSFGGYVYNGNDLATIHSGTTGTDLIAANKGRIYVYSGGVASTTAVNANGYLFVSSGGVADKTTVNDKGIVEGNSGGLIDGVVVNSGGSLLIYNGAKLTGQMTFVAGAEVIPFVGSILDFDLTQTAPDAAALVNDLSILMGTPGYTITVDGTEADGDYKLAEGATGFDKTITVVNTSGTTLGTLTVAGGKTTIGGKDYTLTLNGTGSLGVTLGDGGGATPDITGDLDSYFELTAGMVGSSVNILAGGVLDVLNGGFTSKTTVNGYGALYVSDGGIASDTNVNTDGYAGVNEGGSASGVTIASDGSFDVYSGGTAENVKVLDGGILQVSSGASIMDIDADEGADMALILGESTYAAGKYAGTAFELNGTIDGFTLFCDLTVTKGGTAVNTVVNKNKWLYVESTGVANNTTVNADGYMDVSPGGSASGVTIASDGFFEVYSNGAAENVKVLDGGILQVSSGASIKDIDADEGADLALTLGEKTYAAGKYAGTAFELNGTIDGFTLFCDLTVTKGGTAVNTVVNKDKWLYVESTGVANNTTVNADGYMYVSPGGTAQAAYVSGLLFVGEDGSAETVHVGNLGGIVVSAGGVATNIIVDEGGYATVSGFAGNITLNKGGYATVSEGGLLSGAVVNDGGMLEVYFNGVLSDVTVSAGGLLSAQGESKLTGKVTIETGADVTVYDGAIVDFDLTKTTPGAVALVNDLSFFNGVAVKYTLTVDGTEASGTYKLAGNVASFNKIISVKSVLGEDYGYLTFGGTLSTSFADYTLALADDNTLTVDVVAKGGADTTPPVVENVAADITAPTNGNVTVTAEFSDNVEVAKKLFNLNGGEWQDYPDGGVVVTENDTTVIFKAVDTSGNESEGTHFYTVTNIDKNPPAIYGIAVSPEGPAASVTVNATFEDDVALASQQFKIGDGAWHDYDPATGAVVTENGTIYFKATDTAGNETTESYEVTNIYTGATITVSADITAPTNQNVSVTVTFDGIAQVATYYYVEDPSVKFSVTKDVPEIFTQNCSLVFECYEYSGGPVLAASSFIIDNIDKEAPTITGITPSTTEPAASVTVTANFSDNVALAAQQYQIGDGAWHDYDPAVGVTVTENTTVNFLATDTAGNTATDSYEVTNIQPVGPDTTKPEVKNVAADITAPTNQNVTVTADFTDNVAVAYKYYKLIKESLWLDYDPATGVVMTENGTVYFEAVDTSGNTSDVVTCTVTNIDKEAPTITDIAVSPEGPAASVTVTANFSDNVALAAQQYKIGGGAWQDYDPAVGVTVTENTTVNFLATDTAGNTATDSYEVTNIQPVGPENAPDNGWNDYLYKKGKPNKGWNTDENIAGFASNPVSGNDEIRLDVPGTIDTEDGYHNMFGNNGENKDAGDVAKISVETAAKLTFTIDSTAAGTFYVYEEVKTETKHKQIKVGKVAVKKNKPATLTVCLTAGEGKYYVAMAAKSVKKKGSEGLYNVNVVTDRFFVDADEGTNNQAQESYMVLIGRGAESKPISLDCDPMTGSSEFKNFVGFADDRDYIKLDLQSSAYLKFNVTGDGDGKAKFTVWKQAIGKTKTNLTKVTSVTIPSKKGEYAKSTSAQFLNTDKYVYYVSMECTDASKGKGVYYNVEVADGAVFFDSADNSFNNALYSKKSGFYPEDETHHFESTNIGAGVSTPVNLDSEKTKADGWRNFVGYGDAIDYAKIVLAEDGNLSFDLEFTGDATFTVYRKGMKKGKETLETIQTTKLSFSKDGGTKTTDLLTGLDAGKYYISMAAKSTKATDKGSVFYNVSATLTPQPSSALEMPMAAAAYIDSVQDKLFGETGNGLLASL